MAQELPEPRSGGRAGQKIEVKVKVKVEVEVEVENSPHKRLFKKVCQS